MIRQSGNRLRQYSDTKQITGFQVTGEADGDYAARSVSSAGDFNGDGIDDFLIGANHANSASGEIGVGKTYVIFGRKQGFPEIFSVSMLNGRNGFEIVGEGMQDRSGKVVAGGGDLNGDGYDDIAIASRAADVNGFEDAGTLHVIYGRPGRVPASVALDTLPKKAGFQIEGTIAQDKVGKWVDFIGDVNGDGLDDLGLSATNPTVSDHDDRAYVLYGQERLFPSVFTPDKISGEHGFKIMGGALGERLGSGITGLGDINQDGIDDLLVGMNGYDGLSKNGGAAVILYGTQGSRGDTVDIHTLTNENGYLLTNSEAEWNIGKSVSGAGDVNNDGIPDFLIGAPSAIRDGKETGAAFLVFGTNKPIGGQLTIQQLVQEGLAVAFWGGADGDQTGVSVANAGDINGDGFVDILIGSDKADVNGRESAGTAVLIFGRPHFEENIYDLTNLSESTFIQLDGENAHDHMGRFVSGLGDVNHDGFADFAVGAYGADTENFENAGVAHVYFGGVSIDFF